MNDMASDNSSEIKVIIRTLALLAFLCIAAVCILAYCQYKIPPELNTLTASLVSALTAMLVKTAPTSASPAAPDPIPAPVVPTPVEIKQPEGSPVPVTETPAKPEGTP